MAEKTIHKKKPFFMRVKYSFVISLIIFGLNGIIFPLMLEAPLTIMSFVASGSVSLALMWISIILGKVVIDI